MKKYLILILLIFCAGCFFELTENQLTCSFDNRPAKYIFDNHYFCGWHYKEVIRQAKINTPNLVDNLKGHFEKIKD